MIKAFNLLTLVSILILLVSCSNKSISEYNGEDEVLSQESAEFSQNGQNLRIIPLYEEVLEYTKEMKEEESINNKQVYIDNVLKPFQFIASNNDVNIGNGYFSFFSPTNNINKLEENTIQLLKNQELINDLIKEALLESTAVLPGNDKTFFVMPLSPEDTFPIQEMEGVTGAAFSENAVLVKIDPSFVEEALKYLVAHEYHHTVRMEEAGVMGGTLLDSFITEGQAEVFARSVYPDKTPPWEQEPLTEETKNIILEELTKNIDSTDRDIYIDFVSGNPSKKIPTWANYRLGYRIVESYIENHPSVKVEQWTQLDAEEVLKGSSF